MPVAKKIDGTPVRLTASAMRARYGNANSSRSVAIELAEPALEDLHGLRARRDLRLDLDDRGPRELLEERVRRLRARRRASSSAG